MQYRKKPVVIDAVQFDGTPGGACAVFDAFDIPGARFQPELDNLACGALLIPTLNGDVIARRGEYIVRGVRGEFYPCAPDIFHATHEPVGC
jgi:hypothetical protein